MPHFILSSCRFIPVFTQIFTPLDQPYFIFEPRDVDVLPSSTISLSCRISGAHTAQSRTSWIKNGQAFDPASSGRIQILTDGSLKVTSAQVKIYEEFFFWKNGIAAIPFFLSRNLMSVCTPVSWSWPAGRRWLPGQLGFEFTRAGPSPGFNIAPWTTKWARGRRSGWAAGQLGSPSRPTRGTKTAAGCPTPTIDLRFAKGTTVWVVKFWVKTKVLFCFLSDQ